MYFAGIDICIKSFWYNSIQQLLQISIKHFHLLFHFSSIVVPRFNVLIRGKGSPVKPIILNIRSLFPGTVLYSEELMVGRRRRRLRRLGVRGLI